MSSPASMFRRAADSVRLALPRNAGTSHRPHLLWPFAIYPASGTVEVAFQYLKERAPFDATEQRLEFLHRLNKIDGIDLPEAKLELRPSFPLSVFTEHGDAVCEALDWFLRVLQPARLRPRPTARGRRRGPRQVDQRARRLVIASPSDGASSRAPR
ncbi:hypothetical protein [Streptomyces sp. V1I6]|uniref:hypothetical protein n=1 Tax=Streptomyces sp. V1I6 TaxID=3042273 RepID=UPI0027898DE4|nr:hypothetical protein [Streptomyces sp. V1I6]MDQ0846494.1 hypothetical protein [Streptomyces sp. V1I6]